MIKPVLYTAGTLELISRELLEQLEKRERKFLTNILGLTQNNNLYKKQKELDQSFSYQPVGLRIYFVIIILYYIIKYGGDKLIFYRLIWNGLSQL